MNNLTPNDKTTLVTALLCLVNDEVYNPMEKRDILNEITKELTGFNINDILSETENRRRLVIKNGTRAENDNYLGVAGELTADVETKKLRLHDGVTVGGFEI